MDQVPIIEQMVAELLADQPAYFLVEVRIKPTHNVKVYLDGDNGIAIEKCVTLNRALYKKLDEAGIFPAGEFSLEVSSPGLDEPLKLFRQYRKNVGRPVEVTMKDGRKLEGKMLSVDESGLLLQEYRGRMLNGKPAGKKQEFVDHQLAFDDIKSTHIQITF